MRLPEAGVAGFIRYGEGQLHIKRGSPAVYAFYGDGAAHHAHEALCNGHAKPGALRLAGGSVRFARKHIEHMFRKIGGHANAIVADNEFQAGGFPRAGLQPPHGERDRAVRRRIPDGVGEQVQKDLTDPLLVPPQLFRHIVGYAHGQPVPLGAELWLHDIHDAPDQLRKDEHANVQAGLAAFDLGHVEHIADQAEQMLPGRGDLAGILPHLVRLAGIARQQDGQAGDRINRRTDVMAHVGEERALGAVGGTGVLQRLPEALRHLLLLRAVGQLENKFLRFLNGCMIDMDVEPAVAARFAVHILPIHLLAFPHGNRG